MIFFAIAVFWVFSANSVSQLVLVAIGTLLRLMYITGRGPKIPKELIIFWLVLLITFYALSKPEDREAVIIFLCSVLLLGVLALHVGQQLAAAGVPRRIPAVRQIALFSGRALVLWKRSASDMMFFSKQRIREARHLNRDRGRMVRSAAVGRAYLESRAGFATSMFYEGTRLVERLTAVVSARGEFPSYRLSLLNDVQAPRRWYADLIADVALALLLLIPALLSDSELVPPAILKLFERLSLKAAG